jgi:hypothetical protein
MSGQEKKLGYGENDNDWATCRLTIYRHYASP